MSTVPPRLVYQLERHRRRVLSSAQRQRDTLKWMRNLNSFFTHHNIWAPIKPQGQWVTMPRQSEMPWAIKMPWMRRIDLLRARYPSVQIAKRVSSRPLP